MLSPSSQRKSSQREAFDLGLHASHHLKNNRPKGRIPKRWDKNPVQEILPEGRIINTVLLIEGYLHISTFYSAQEGLLKTAVPKHPSHYTFKCVRIHMRLPIIVPMTNKSSATSM